MYVYLNVCMYVGMCVCICMNVRMHFCNCVWMHRRMDGYKNVHLKAVDICIYICRYVHIYIK